MEGQVTESQACEQSLPTHPVYGSGDFDKISGFD
jgi:hypothetical protein